MAIFHRPAEHTFDGLIDELNRGGFYAKYYPSLHAYVRGLEEATRAELLRCQAELGVTQEERDDERHAHYVLADDYDRTSAALTDALDEAACLRHRNEGLSNAVSDLQGTIDQQTRTIHRLLGMLGIPEFVDPDPLDRSWWLPSDLSDAVCAGILDALNGCYDDDEEVL